MYLMSILGLTLPFMEGCNGRRLTSVMDVVVLSFTHFECCVWVELMNYAFRDCRRLWWPPIIIILAIKSTFTEKNDEHFHVEGFFFFFFHLVVFGDFVGTWKCALLVHEGAHWLNNGSCPPPKPHFFWGIKCVIIMKWLSNSNWGHSYFSPSSFVCFVLSWSRLNTLFYTNVKSLFLLELPYRCLHFVDDYSNLQ